MPGTAPEPCEQQQLGCPDALREALATSAAAAWQHRTAQRESRLVFPVKGKICSEP